MASSAHEQDQEGSEDAGSDDPEFEADTGNLRDDITLQTEVTDNEDNKEDAAADNENGNRPGKMQLDYRPPISMENMTDEQALQQEFSATILKNRPVEFDALLGAVKDVNKIGFKKWNMLTTAVLKQRTYFVKKLLERGINIHKRDHKKRTVLHIACEKGYAEIAQLLLLHRKENASVYLRTEKSKQSQPKVGAERPSHLNAVDNELNTPLHYAAFRGHADVISSVLLNSALHSQLCLINLQNDTNSQTALHVAASKGHLDCVKAILNYSPDVKAAGLDDTDGKVAEQYACDLNAQDKDGATAIYVAISKRRLSVVECLLRRGADLNVVKKNGMVAVMVAAQTKQSNVVSMLLDVKKYNKDSEEPKLWVENKYHRNLLYYLSKYKCDDEVYEQVLGKMKEMLQSCLIFFYPDLPDAIAKVLADMTYGTKKEDALKSDAARMMNSGMAGMQDVTDKPSQ